MKSSFEIMEHAWNLYSTHIKQFILILLTIAIVNSIPSFAFPWSIIPNTPAPSASANIAFVIVHLISILLYLYLVYAFILESWRLLTHASFSLEETLKTSAMRFFHTLLAHLSVSLLAVLSIIPYIALYWLLFENSLITQKTILAWPLVFGLPLLFPAIYILTRFIAVPFIVLLDTSSITHAYKMSSTLTIGRWFEVFKRIFVPAFFWSILNIVMLLVLIIIVFLALSINPYDFTLSQSYALILTQNILESFIFFPLTTMSLVILYNELKKSTEHIH